MRWAVISDIHANAVALDAVLEDAARQGAESVLCLGDIVGYGPQPAEALARVRAVATVVVAGNHDDAVSGRGDASCFIDLAADAAARHRDALSRAERRWLASLPYVHDGGSFRAVHGEPAEPAAFGYIANADDAARAFEAFDSDLLFVGHTHVPSLFVRGASGKAHAIDPVDFALEPGKRYIVNPGSVGYPRNDKGACFASYAIYDDAMRSVFYRYIPFAVGSVLQRGRGHRKVAPFVAAGVALVTVIGGSVIAWRTRSVPVSMRVPEVAAVAAVETPVRQIVFEAGGLRNVRPDVKLARGSAPVEARIVFRDAHGNALDTVPRRVKQSWRAAVPVPRDAVRAELFGATNGARIVRFELTGVPAHQ